MGHRTIKQIKTDIERCQQQISIAMEQPTSEDAQITISGFQLQLTKLQQEYNQAVKNIEVINPILVHPTSNETLFI